MNTTVNLTTSQLDNLIVNHPFFAKAKAELTQCIESFGNTPEPRCIPIFGPSGSGKSTAIREFAEGYAAAEGETGWERPVLVVETPSNPTPKTFASEVLKQLGDPLYFKGSEVQMFDRIIKLIEEQKVRLIIFDEMQSLIDRDSAKLNHKVADWLKRLINLARIPTVVVGLAQTEKLFFANEQLRRRFRTACMMSSFNWHDKEKRKILRGFLSGVEEKLNLEEGLNLSSNQMAFRFYCATNGLVGYIMAIIREARDLSRNCQVPEIRMSHLAQAYENVVCGNNLIGVNPFSDVDQEDLEKALIVVEPSLVSKGALKEKSGKGRRSQEK